jgi:hypothetical protein
MHDWVVANENMARVLAAKKYPYQFVFARNAGHTDKIQSAFRFIDGLLRRARNDVCKCALRLDLSACDRDRLPGDRTGALAA